MTKSDYYKKHIVNLGAMAIALLLLMNFLQGSSGYLENYFSKPIAEKINYFIIIIVFGGVGGYFIGKANAISREWKKQIEITNTDYSIESELNVTVSLEEQAERKKLKNIILGLVMALMIATIATGDIYRESAKHFYSQLYILFFIPSLIFVAAYTKIKLVYFWNNSDKKDALFMVIIFSVIVSFALSKSFELLNSKLGGQDKYGKDYLVISTDAASRQHLKILLETDDKKVSFILPKAICEDSIDNNRFSKKVYVGSLGYRYIKGHQVDNYINYCH